MHDFGEWLLQRKKARRTKPEWGLLRERRSTPRCWGWSYTSLMPFADLWHASPVCQKENCALSLPPAALIQWKPAAWGASWCVIACSWCWKMSVVHTCLHQTTERYHLLLKILHYSCVITVYLKPLLLLYQVVCTLHVSQLAAQVQPQDGSQARAFNPNHQLEV